MKNFKALLLGAVSLAMVGGTALAQNGFSVGGVGSFEGEGANPFTSIGYPSVPSYLAAKAKGYAKTPEDATLWADANTADNASNSSTQINGASCSTATYGVLSSSCSGTCVNLQRDAFSDRHAFNKANSCLTPSSYDNLADYQSAIASNKGYGLTSTDAALWAEAKTSAIYTNYCAPAACNTLTKTAFLAVKDKHSLFVIARDNRAATPTTNGTLFYADLTDTGVVVPSPWTAAPYQGWLMSYLNDKNNNQTGNTPTNSATHPFSGSSSWKTKITNLAEADVAIWVIQQIADGNSGYLPADLSSQLLASAGLSTSIANNATYVANATSNVASKTAAELDTTAKISAWISALVPPTFADASAITLNKNEPDVNSANTVLVSSMSATDANGAATSFSLTGASSSNFAINASGQITNTASLAPATYNFNVVATDNNSVDSIPRVVSVIVNATPTIAFTCTDATQQVGYTCSPTASDADSGDTLSYSWNGGQPSWLTLNTSTGVITGTPNTATTYDNISITVSDSKISASSAAFSILVNPNNAALASTAASSAANGTLTKAELDTLLTNFSATPGVPLTNAVNLDYVEHCIAAYSSPTPQQVVNCAKVATPTGAAVFNVAGKLNGAYSGAVSVADLTSAGIDSFDTTSGDQNVITFLNSNQCGSDFTSSCSAALSSSICGSDGASPCQNASIVSAAGTATQAQILAYVRDALASYIVKVADTATQAPSQSGDSCGSVTVNGPAVCNNSAFTCSANKGWAKGSANGFTNFSKSIGNVGSGNQNFDVTYTAKSWWGLPGYTRTVTQNLQLSVGSGVTTAYSKHSFGARNDAIAMIAKACFAQSGNPTIMTQAQINATSGIGFSGGYWFLPTSEMPASAWPNSNANPWGGGSLKYWFQYGSNPGFSSSKSLKVYYNYYGINTSNGKKLITRTDNDNFNPSGSVWCKRTACGSN